VITNVNNIPISIPNQSTIASMQMVLEIREEDFARLDTCTQQGNLLDRCVMNVVQQRELDVALVLESGFFDCVFTSHSEHTMANGEEVKASLNILGRISGATLGNSVNSMSGL
jgi:hypothetical protein